jgi:hypothetical protein
MDEEIKETQQKEQNPPEQTQAGAENASGAGAVSFDEMLKGGYQAEFDRRVTKALNTARSKWEQEQADNADEAKRLEKMNATQREQYQLNKDKEAFAQQKAAFAAEQMRVTVGAELQKRGLDAGFAKYLSGKTAEESTANLNEFESLWNKAISGAVNSRMRGDGAPKEPQKAAYTTEGLKKMSRAEINANWGEISKFLSEQKG